MKKLVDLGLSKDRRFSTFAGTAVYTATFDVKNTDLSMLNLGTVHGVSEVTLNGKDLGVRWWGEHVYDASSILEKGEITISPFSAFESARACGTRVGLSRVPPGGVACSAVPLSGCTRPDPTTHPPSETPRKGRFASFLVLSDGVREQSHRRVARSVLKHSLANQKIGASPPTIH